MSPDHPLSDTTPEARRVQIAALRAMGIEGRARVVLDLNEMVRELGRTGIRMRHPGYGEEEIRLAMLRLWLGNSLFREVYGGIEVRP